MKAIPNHRQFHRPPGPAGRRGAALFISLMFLIILTLIGLSAANVGILQERMAGSVRETNQAFQRAEETLREIETRIDQDLANAGGGLGAIVNWPEAKSEFGLEHRDCLLAGAPVNDWPWAPALDAEQSNFVVFALSQDKRPNGEPIGPPCSPMDDQGGLSGNVSATPVAPYYLIATRATGKAGTGDVILQSIYFTP